MLHCFPVSACVRVTEKAIAEGQTGLVGSIGCVLAEGRAARARATGTREQKEISTQAGWWPQAKGSAHRVRSDRVRAAHGVPVEGATEGSIRQRQRDTQTVPGMGKRGILPCPMASGASRVRRHGGYRLALAKRRRGSGESPASARVCWAKSDGSGEKMAASGCCWWTRVASRCRSS
jgi:hypothetical protein